MSGPLTMAAISLFGNHTFFDMGVAAWNKSSQRDLQETAAYQDICNIVPFARLDPRQHKLFPEDVWSDSQFPGCDPDPTAYRDKRKLTEYVAEWLHGFNDTDTGTKAISTAVVLANQAAVTMDKWRSAYDNDIKNSTVIPGVLQDGGLRNTGSEIYAGVGTNIRKPSLSTTAIIIISCLLLLELLGLAILAFLIYRGPSETRTLDAMAFAKLETSIRNRTATHDSTIQSIPKGGSV
ncbi:hypothetical protein DM02DRAFT_605875 [Periconia macrospinosa]|uniref:Uncharacterized protein n=1 Tax=Periconia macrospinosa TaxID=97972 RepID=A0A2V1D3G8_9PLEO|nr:hypothetical protein DM02DRAFT_605875 [Periconia macrospinosa]